MIFVQKRICLSCRKFRLEDPVSGICRVVKGLSDYPLKGLEESCGKWVDGGHQYSIRRGWIKTTLAREKDSQSDKISS